MPPRSASPVLGSDLDEELAAALGVFRAGSLFFHCA
jgi:hypothetical protein